MAKKSITLFIILTFVLIAGCNSLSPEDTETEDYPVFFRTLDIQQLIELNEQFHKQNSNLLCSTLNEYGFTGFSRVLFPGDVNPCLNREELKVELPYSDELLAIAKQTLEDNKDFTGVEDSDQLTLKEVISLDGCTICEGNINNVPLQWKFTFNAQKFEGIEVLDTEIIVYIDSNGPNRIWGNWYRLNTPGFIEVGTSGAKEEIIGLKLRYANAQNQIFEQEVETKHIKGTPLLTYSALEVENGIEIHRAWEFEILLEATGEVKWKVYVSTQTGEVLESKLL